MLDAAPVEQAIIVTGRGLEAEEGPAARLTILRTEIERSASGRMEDVLRDVAGLASFRRSDARSAHPTSQGLTLRGLGGNAASRVGLTLDGVPQADPFGGWIAFGALDPNAIDRIRVERGGGPYGVAGHIDVDSRAPDGAMDGAVSLSFGSRDSVDARVIGGVRWGDGYASLSGNFERGDGFVPIVAGDRGAADRAAPYRQSGGRARVVQSVGASTEAQFSLSSYRDRRSRGTDFSGSRQRGTDASVRLVGRGPLGWSALAYVQDRQFDSQFAAVNANRSAASLTLDQHVPARGYGARVEVEPRIGALRTSFGAEWRRVTGETAEDFRFVAGAPTRTRKAGGRNATAGLFGGAAWSEGGWSLAAQARADHWAMADGRLIESDLAGARLTDSHFHRRSRWEWSGRVAAGRTLSKALTARAAAYHGWRLPTLNELYRPFRAGADATAANAALDPERLRGIEAGLDWAPIEAAKLSATIFANRLSGAITNVTLGKGPGTFPGVGFVGAGGVYRARQNVDSILSRGLELDGRFERGPWRGALSYTFIDARIDASGAAAELDGKRPAQVARHYASASVGWAQGKFALDATARFTGRQFEDDSNRRILPAALAFDAVGRFELARHIGIGVRAENMLDTRVVATVLADGVRERALPRTLWVDLRLR
ncbi:MAG: TonB-dependent receptor [Sphingomicrobium sp.]